MSSLSESPSDLLSDVSQWIRISLLEVWTGEWQLWFGNCGDDHLVLLGEEKIR